ncbi:MAG: hypothetical protein IKH16_01940, partial [Selenomonadaceae bacterium]|nr:hypothetical protein [Selenomonadaceae bacterium]
SQPKFLDNHASFIQNFSLFVKFSAIFSAIPERLFRHSQLQRYEIFRRISAPPAIFRDGAEMP